MWKNEYTALESASEVQLGFEFDSSLTLRVVLALYFLRISKRHGRRCELSTWFYGIKNISISTLIVAVTSQMFLPEAT